MQTATLRDLVPEGVAARVETDPHVAALKSNARLVTASEAAVRFYEEPPARGMTITTGWDDLHLSAEGWAEAFDAPDPGTPHNEAREQVWEELVEILTDQPTTATATPASPSVDVVAAERELRADVRPRVAAARPRRPGRRPLVGARLPAHLRSLAQPRRRPRAAARGPPGLDGVRPAAPGRRASAARRSGASADGVTGTAPSSPPSGQEMAEVVDHLIATDDSEMHVMSMLRGDDVQYVLVDEAVQAQTDPDLLAGPFAHIVVDEAQELTDAQWQMLLPRCPSRSFTIVGDRAQARHGFTESWQERLERVGLDPRHPGLADDQLPHARGGHGRGRAGHPCRPAGRQRADLDPQHRPARRPWIHLGAGRDPRHLGSRAPRRDRLRHRRPHLPGRRARPVTHPGAGEGPRVRPRRAGRPRCVRRRAWRAPSTATSR